MKVQVRSGTVKQGTELKSYQLGDAIGPQIDLRKNNVKPHPIFFGGDAFGVLGRPTHETLYLKTYIDDKHTFSNEILYF